MLRVVNVEEHDGRGQGVRVKSVGVGIDDPAAADLLGQGDGDAASDTRPTVSPAELYRRVAWYHRAVALRAGAVASLPFALSRGPTELDREGAEYQRWADDLKELLAITEGDLATTGSAYWLVTPNRHGWNYYPRRLLPKSITPKYNKNGELTHFVRRFGGANKSYPAYQNRNSGASYPGTNNAFIIHFWSMNLDAEDGPGVGPAHAAQFAAETLYHLGRYTRRFFMQGALKSVLFFLDTRNTGAGMTPQPSEQELEGIVGFWKRMTGGVGRAWNTMAMRYNFVPHEVGTSPKDIAAPDLTSINRADIAAAFGIPQSLLESNASTYANASVDEWHFTHHTIVPHVNAHYRRPLNEFFALFGMRLEWRPQEMQAYEAAQVAETASLVPLVDRGLPLVYALKRLGFSEEAIAAVEEQMQAGGRTQSDILGYHIETGTVKRNEARERLGLPPEDETADEQRREVTAALTVLQAATNAGLPLDVGLALAQVPGVRAAMDGPAARGTSAQARRARALAERLQGVRRERPTEQRERDGAITA